MTKVVTVTFDFVWNEADGDAEAKRLAYAAMLRKFIENSSDDQIAFHIKKVRQGL